MHAQGQDIQMTASSRAPCWAASPDEPSGGPCRGHARTTGLRRGGRKHSFNRSPHFPSTPSLTRRPSFATTNDHPLMADSTECFVAAQENGNDCPDPEYSRLCRVSCPPLSNGRAAASLPPGAC